MHAAGAGTAEQPRRQQRGAAQRCAVLSALATYLHAAPDMQRAAVRSWEPVTALFGLIWDGAKSPSPWCAPASNVSLQGVGLFMAWHDSLKLACTPPVLHTCGSCCEDIIGKPAARWLLRKEGVVQRWA